jgi:hypothetical protein
MKHAVVVGGATTSYERIHWSCLCGAGRQAANIFDAGAEAHRHLRNMEEGLES